MSNIENNKNPTIGDTFAWDEYYACTDTILVYGLKSQQYQLLNNLAQTLKFKIFECASITDIIAIPSFMIILNPKEVSYEDMAMLIECWEYQKINECRVLFIDTPHSCQQKKFPPCVKVSLALFDDVEKLRLQILNQKNMFLKQLKKDRHYEERILRILSIQRELQRGLVKTKNLAEKFNVSPRTIQRDISILERLGELISYDEREKAYFILNRESLF